MALLATDQLPGQVVVRIGNETAIGDLARLSIRLPRMPGHRREQARADFQAEYVPHISTHEDDKEGPGSGTIYPNHWLATRHRLVL